MNKLIVASVLALGAVGPAAAQVNAMQLEDLRVQQQAAERRAIDQANQIQALEARLRADQAVANVSAQAAGALAPQLRYPDPAGRVAAPMSTPTSTPTSTRYPSMPDAALADSNRRVQDAARTRR